MQNSRRKNVEKVGPKTTPKGGQNQMKPILDFVGREKKKAPAQIRGFDP
jgi:hypothetical protein